MVYIFGPGLVVMGRLVLAKTAGTLRPSNIQTANPISRDDVELYSTLFGGTAGCILVLEALHVGFL